MMNDFIYYIPTKVYFGKDQMNNLGAELKKYGKRVLMTYGGGSIKKIGLYDRVVKEIRDAGLELFELSGIEPNPRIDSVRKGAQMCKEHHIDVLLAVGGGSTIDATKFMAAGACVDHDPWDFLDLDKRSPIEKALPIVTILTLSATGSEMDMGGVISNPETKDKIGRLAPAMLPKASFLDPTNTFTVSPYQTACGAADMLSHIFEVYFNNNLDLYMLDCFMEGMMKTIIKYAPIAMREPDNYEARANLMWTSSWAINGFIDGGKRQPWSCHPMEHEVSAIYDITHGLGLAIITPRWMEYCLDDSTVDKYVQFGVNVFGIDAGSDAYDIANKAIDETYRFFESIGIPMHLREVGIDESRIDEMAHHVAVNEDLEHAWAPLLEKDIAEIFTASL